MKLPNAKAAVIDYQTLTSYCLNLEHSRGKHKARKFASVFGLTLVNADQLYDALVRAARNEKAVEDMKDEFGQRHTVDFQFIGPAGQGIVRSAWIIRQGEAFPRFVTAFVLG